jgi:hypothetical protein
MRPLIPVFAALMLATASIAAQAQTVPPSSATAAPASPKPHRITKLSQRFAAANTSHDGHLTLDQAKAAKWVTVVRHFSRIDADQKGYVTEADIRAAETASRAAKAAAPVPAKS